jgi:hypothetical protein
MAQHVRMRLDTKPCPLRRPLQHSRKPPDGERRPALTHEYEWARWCFSLQLHINPEDGRSCQGAVGRLPGTP